MRSYSKWLGSAVTGVCLAIAANGITADGAVAGEIKVSTVRIDLSDKQSSSSLTVTNSNAQKSIVQLRAMLWSQKDGHDATEPTDDLIVNPPIAEIEPSAKQLVRIGYRGKLQANAERSYRLVVEEVPPKDRERKQVIETYLKISVPIFIAPLGKPEGRLSAMLSRNSVGNVILRNDGTVHIRLVAYGVMGHGTALATPHQGLFYVLPGANVVLPLDPRELNPAMPAELDILGDDGHVQLPLTQRSE
jgi:fimbrial chaperone protein